MRNIQIFAGPATGKSTICSGLFYNMKTLGYKVEFIAEFAKGLTYGNDTTKLRDQLLVVANQYHKFFRIKDLKLDYLIHESPMLLSLAYFQEDEIMKKDQFTNLVVSMYKNMNSINIFLQRNLDFKYQEFGRSQKLEEAIELDRKIMKILDDNDINYYIIKSDDKTVNRILELIKELK